MNVILYDKFIRQLPFLLTSIIIIYIVKPNILFKPNGKPRVYGIGKDDEGYKKTLYTFQFLIIILALIINYIF
jgi:hypothetical protein